MRMNSVSARVGKALVGAMLVALSAPAFAYIGPGAGVSFLGSLWAVLVGIVLAIVAVLAWPVRWLWRRLQRQRSLVRNAKPPAVE